MGKAKGGRRGVRVRIRGAVRFSSILELENFGFVTLLVKEHQLVASTWTTLFRKGGGGGVLEDPVIWRKALRPRLCFSRNGNSRPAMNAGQLTSLWLRNADTGTARLDLSVTCQWGEGCRGGAREQNPASLLERGPSWNQ